MCLKILFSRTLRHFLSRNTSVLLHQRSTTLHEKTSLLGAKQFFNSKFFAEARQKGE